MESNYFDTVKTALREAVEDLYLMKRYICKTDYETVGTMTIHDKSYPIECVYEKDEVYDVLIVYNSAYEGSIKVFIINKLGKKCEVFNEKNYGEFKKRFKYKCAKAVLDSKPLLDLINTSADSAEYFEEALIKVQKEIDYEKERGNSTLKIRELAKKERIIMSYRGR